MAEDLSNFVVYFDHVSKTFTHPVTGKTTYAIHDVSFSVEDLPGAGEFICLLGPSGCGKSTVLKLIAGLDPQHPPSAGRVVVKGQAVTGPGADRGMVFQTYSSYPCYNVLENVAFGLKLRGLPRREREDMAKHWIDRVHLTGSEYKFPKELSGGMQQRVAIARTLAVKPKIILMDEPFGALDRVTRWEMQDLLLELWNSVETTVFLVTHDIPEAVYLGDRVYIFSPSPGRLAEEVRLHSFHGKAAEVQRRHDFTEMVDTISAKVEKWSVLKPGAVAAAVVPAPAPAAPAAPAPATGGPSAQ